MSRLMKKEPIRTPPTTPRKVKREPTREQSQTPQTPQTPSKKRTIDVPLTPDSTKKVKLDATPNTPNTPNTPSVYSLGKSVFQRGSSSTGIIGRDNERSKIYQFIKSRLNNEHNIHNGALYMNGLPGTGKSALLLEVLDELKAHTTFNPRIANINCMIVDRPAMIYSRILKALEKDQTDDADDEEDEDEELLVDTLLPRYGPEKAISRLDALFLNQTRPSIVVLDELDHVITKDQEVLFKIFQWAFMKSSNLILIGIANALDLTDRFLPRLRSNNLTPELLPFSPYSASEIESIIVQKLRSLSPPPTSTTNTNTNTTTTTTNTLPLMQLSAIQLCSRKSAANTGDLRKAFDICRRSIEVVEEEVRRKIAMNENPPSWKDAIINGHKSSALTSLSLYDAPKVTVAHIAKVCNSAFGGSTTGRIKSLNLQQKAILCVLVTSESTTASLTVSKLFEKYSQICEKEKAMSGLHFNEYLEVISALEFTGVVNISGVCGRKGLGVSNSRRRTSRGGAGASSGQTTLGSREEFSQRRISSNVHRMDLLTAISDIPLLTQFLESNL